VKPLTHLLAWLMALASASLLDKAVASAHRDPFFFFSCRALMLGSAFVPENVRVTQSSGFTSFDCIGVLARSRSQWSWYDSGVVHVNVVDAL
jgi:hypothetical protein